MQRLVFDKGKTYVVVYRSLCGKRKETRLYNGYWPDYLRNYRVVGVFEQVTNRDRSYEIPTDNPSEYNGIPEGTVWCSSRKKYVKSTCEYPIPRRRDYQNKLQHILKKAKELIALGIERKAALQAARKCECHR